MKRSWTKRKVREAILELHKTTGRLNYSFARTKHLPLFSAACRYFGNWQKAVRAVGINYSSVCLILLRRRWSKAAVVAEIKHRRKQGLSLNGAVVSNEDRGLYEAARRFFGPKGWDKALCQVGLSSAKIHANFIWTGEQVIDEIHQLHQSGSPLYWNHLNRNGYKSLLCGAERQFGSWRKAIQAAGLDYEKVLLVVRPGWSKWTNRRVVEEIQRLERLGIRLSYRATRRTRPDLCKAAIKRFGSWSQAVEAAGINYHTHSLIWSTKAWLRKLTPKDVRILNKRVEALQEREE